MTGLRVIRAFAREDFQEERFDSKNEEYKGISSRLFKLTGLTEPSFVFIIISMIVAIVWFALNPLSRGDLQIGNLVAFIDYGFHALFSFLLLPISLPCILVLLSQASVFQKLWQCQFQLLLMKMV